MRREKPVIYTERTILKLAHPNFAEATMRFRVENREHLAPWSPAQVPDYFTLVGWLGRLENERKQFDEEKAIRLYVFLKSAPENVIGTIGFSNIVRGVGQFCNLGYNLDFREQGKGLMTESLKAGIEYVFEKWNLHRIIASYLPRNHRSAAVLKRLGFEVEGLCRELIRINGSWEDHVQTSLINRNWRDENLKAEKNSLLILRREFLS